MAYILIVDDSEFQKSIVAKFLREHQHITIEAKDGEQAYKLAIEKQPDLVLMDVVMPDCNGYQSIRMLQRDPRTKQIPVVMVSTKSLAIDKVWAKKQGAIGYVTKPIDKKTLINAVNAALDARGR